MHQVRRSDAQRTRGPRAHGRRAGSSYKPSHVRGAGQPGPGFHPFGTPTADDQIAAGYTTFCSKPSRHTDNLHEVEPLCRHIVDTVRALAADD
jgi:hypothetical protein